MQIEIGKYYVNKTWKYLRPCLKGHGKTFLVKFNSLFKLAMGIHDCALDGTDFENYRLIYILVDKFYMPRVYKSFSDWIKFQEYYVTDYVYDTHLPPSKMRMQMFVLTIPEQYQSSYDHFIKGQYSKMYTRDQIEELYPEGVKDHGAKEVLLQTFEARREFVEKVNKSFNSTVTEEDMRGCELDFTLEKKKENFNYS